MNGNKLVQEDYKTMMKILEGTCIGNITKVFEDVYLILKPYNINEEYFKVAFDHVVLESNADCTDADLIRELLVYQIHIEPYDFVEIFNKYTDYTTSEINVFINIHCEMFNVNISDYSFHSSALDGL